MLGDVNVIDYDALHLPLPELVHDLPADARRFVQGSRVTSRPSNAAR